MRSKTQLKGKTNLSWFRVFIYVTILGGFFIRLFQLEWRSFWLDEAYLANIVVMENIDEVFNVNQYLNFAFPPPLFTTTLYLISNILQPNEFNLRLLPAISGILCLPLVYKLTKSFFDEQTAAIALFLCSFNSIFIFFSKELKQYTTEALFALFAIYITERVIDNNRVRSFGYFLITCLLGFGFSHSFVFIFPILSIVICVNVINKRSILAYLNLIFGFIAFGIYYMFFLKKYIASKIIEYWTHAYVDYSSFPNFIWWHCKKTYSLFSAYSSFPKSLGILHEIYVLIILCIFFLGLYRCYKNKSRFLSYLIVPISLAYFLALIHRYPVTPRTYLFTLPLVLITIAVGLRNLGFIIKLKIKSSLAMLSFFLFLGTSYAFKPIYKYIIFYDKEYMRVEQIRTVLDKVKINIRNDDLIHIHPRATIAYKFYKNILNKKVIYGNFREYYFKDDNGKRIWIIFSHLNESQRQEYIEYMDDKRDILLTIIEPGAAAYLFDVASTVEN